MKKESKCVHVVGWLTSLIFLLALVVGCAHQEKKNDDDLFFKQWKATAEKSKGYSPKARKRNLEMPPRVLSAEAMKQKTAKEERPLPTQKITIRMHQTDVAVLLRALTRSVGLNLVVNENVKGTVNIDVKEASWDEVFLSILSSQGLSYTWEGDIIRIVTPEDKNKSLEQLATEQKIKAQQKDMELVEPLITRVVEVQFANAAKLKTNLEKFLSLDQEGKPIGSVMVDEHTNALIIQAIYNDLKRILPLIGELDKPTPQILIEAHIIEASKETSMELGVQGGGLLNDHDVWFYPGANSNGVVGNQLSAGGIDPTSGWAANFPSPSGTAASVSGFTIGFAVEDVGKSIIAAQLAALQSEGKVNILSSPSITTLDNQKATIESGKEVPYQTVDNGEVKIEYKKAVLSLEVTPHVIGESTLKLNISTKKDELDFANAVQGQPAISTKKAETNVLLFDGQTTVIGGLSKENSLQSESGLPWLKDIPILGYLFKGRRTSDDMEEVLIFITPHILGEHFTEGLEETPVPLQESPSTTPPES
jgi:type IV pilus secretin PilQ/predicted competence protein